MTDSKIHIRMSGTVGFGTAYGEQSYNGEPINSVTLEKDKDSFCIFVPQTKVGDKVRIKVNKVLRKFAMRSN